MSETGSVSSEDRQKRAESRLAASRLYREAAAATHAREIEGVEQGESTIRSFHVDEIRKIKVAITRDAPYADRISFGFALRLFRLEQDWREADNVLREIDFLEGLSATSITQTASQFKHAPLAPLWHKHFWSPRHLWRNVGNRWGIHPDKMANKHKALDAMLSSVARDFGENPHTWQEASAYKFIMGAIEERAAEKRMTGDWIIYAKRDGRNYYLDLAQHHEGANPQQLVEKIRVGSQGEFPFLFSR